EHHLRKAIESVIEQSLIDFEFIIIIDNPKAIGLKTLIYEYARKDSRIKFIENDINIGLAMSLNKGLNQASGKYIVRMDADDICDLNRFYVQHKFMEDNPSIDMVSTNVNLIDENDELLK